MGHVSKPCFKTKTTKTTAVRWYNCCFRCFKWKSVAGNRLYPMVHDFKFLIDVQLHPTKEFRELRHLFRAGPMDARSNPLASMCVDGVNCSSCP